MIENDGVKLTEEDAADIQAVLAGSVLVYFHSQMMCTV